MQFTISIDSLQNYIRKLLFCVCVCGAPSPPGGGMMKRKIYENLMNVVFADTSTIYYPCDYYVNNVQFYNYFQYSIFIYFISVPQNTIDLCKIDYTVNKCIGKMYNTYVHYTLLYIKSSIITFFCRGKRDF